MHDQQQSTDNPLALLHQANEVLVEILGNITPEQMTLPTPNDEWDVRTLINHLVAGNMWSADLVRQGSAQRPSGDVIGDRSPLDAYQESWQAASAAFAEPGALGRTVQMSFGEMPAAGFAMLRFIDLLSHTWDLAKPTGQNTDLAPELCEIALALSREQFAGRDREHMPFNDEVSISGDAPAADRLAGYLGKQP